MKTKWTVAVALLAFAVATAARPAVAAESNANAVTKALNTILEGRGICRGKDRSKTVMCIVNAVPTEADKLARGIVFQVNAMNIDMSGWKLTLVTPDDYVVSRQFQSGN